MLLDLNRLFALFQSTHPVWDATCDGAPIIIRRAGFQSTHPVWDATRCESMSICRPIFQSTHPVWDATFARPSIRHALQISIHASRMGCDLGDLPDGFQILDFNPRIPYGMRPDQHCRPLRWHRFQSTHPVWDATTVEMLYCRMFVISIHASRMGCDVKSFLVHRDLLYFNPRIPYGMRRGTDDTFAFHNDFNPRIPYGMRPAARFKIAIPHVISIHASRMGCDSLPSSTCRTACEFQSTHPVWDATARMDIAFHNMEIIARSSS